MRENDIIEKIHKVYDQKEPDILSRLKFSEVEMVEPTEKKLKERYISAVAVYVAACLVVAIALPFLIGGRGETPGVNPGHRVTDATQITKATEEDIADDIIDKFMAALERGIAEGRIEDRDYDREELLRIGHIDDGESDIHVFDFGFNYAGPSFVYSDDDVYPIQTNLPVYMPGRVQTCDIDRNGKDDLLIYGTWGSGVYGYSLIYFDSSTNTMTDLFVGSFFGVHVEEEIGEDGDMQYSIYTGFYEDEGIFVGTLEYENGKIVTKLIREGSLSEVVYEVLKESSDSRN